MKKLYTIFTVTEEGNLKVFHWHMYEKEEDAIQEVLSSGNDIEMVVLPVYVPTKS